MKSESIDRMSKSKRLKLTLWQSGTHYWPVILTSLIPIFTAYSLLEIYVFHTYDGVRSAEELISGTWVWIPISIIVWGIQWYRLRFRIINTSISSEQFEEAVKRTATELNWKINSKKKFSLRARRYADFTGSWGEMITIFYKDNKLYLNAIPDPDNLAAMTTFGGCKKARETFLRNLEEIQANLPAKELEEETGFMTKWTFWAVIIRIFIYPLALGLIFLGGYIIYNGGSWVMGLILCFVAITFLYSDIKIMFGRKP